MSGRASLVVLVLAAGVLSACGTSAGSSASTVASTVSPSPTSTVPTEAVVGLSVDDADAWAVAHGYTTRVVSIDGVTQPVTMDFRENRINLVEVKGIVTSATLG